MKDLLNYLSLTKTQLIIIIGLGLIVGLTNTFILFIISSMNSPVSAEGETTKLRIF